jgi:transposase
MAGSKLHANDTPVPVLAPGMGRTKTARLWTYVRDDRPAGSDVPPAVWLAYSPDRKGEHPRQRLKDFCGVLQADACAGFGHLYQAGHIQEAACMAHVRRKFYDIQVANGSPIAAEAIQRIGALYEIEREIRGKPIELRHQIRQMRGRTLVEELHVWMNKTLAKISRKSDTAGAIRYALSRWRALTRYLDDGRIELDNSAAERALRAVALGRKNFLFAGSDSGGERAACLYSLLGTAKAFKSPLLTTAEVSNSTVDLMLQFIESKQMIEIADLMIERVGSASVNGELVTKINHPGNLFLGLHYPKSFQGPLTHHRASFDIGPAEF